MHLDQRIAAIKRVEGVLAPLQEEGFDMKRVVYDDEVDDPFAISVYIHFTPLKEAKLTIL